MFWGSAALPPISFCKLPILCPGSHPSRTQPSSCLGQATELLLSFLFSTCPARRLPLSPQLQHPHSCCPHSPLLPNPMGWPQDPARALGGLLSLLSPANKRRALKPLSRPPGGQREGRKGQGTFPVSPQQQSSILTFSSPQARPQWWPGHRGMSPCASPYKLWRNVCRGRGVC